MAEIAAEVLLCRLEQAKYFTKAFLSGQPRKATIAPALFKDKIRDKRSYTRFYSNAAPPSAPASARKQAQRANESTRSQ